MSTYLFSRYPPARAPISDRNRHYDSSRAMNPGLSRAQSQIARNLLPKVRSPRLHQRPTRTRARANPARQALAASARDHTTSRALALLPEPQSREPRAARGAGESGRRQALDVVPEWATARRARAAKRNRGVLAVCDADSWAAGQARFVFPALPAGCADD